MNRLLAALAVLSTAFLGAPADAGSERPTVEVTNVDISAYPTVTLTVPVVDLSGNPIGGLSVEDFSVTQNGAAAEVKSATLANESDIGAGVVLVIDVSGSMQGAAMEAAKVAARDFVNGLSPADRVAIVTFASTVQLVHTFDADRAQAINVINGLTPAGDTALYEAAARAIEFSGQSGLSRNAIILLSDGANDDPDGGPAPELVHSAAEQAGVPFFTVALGAGADPAFTQRLADVSGGKAYTASDPTQLPGLYSAVAQRIASEYIVEYLAPHDVGEQLVTVAVDDALNAHVTASTSFDVLSARSSEPGGPVVGLPMLEPGASVGFDRSLSPAIDAPGGTVADVSVLVDGVAQATLYDEPYEYLLEPARYSVGRHELRFEVRDEQGRLGRYDTIIDIAEAQPKLVFTGLSSSPLSEGDEIGVEVLAQGQAADSVVIRIGDQETAFEEVPYLVEVPSSLVEGEVAIEATTVLAGQEVSSESGFLFEPERGGPNPLPIVAGLAALGGLAFLVYRIRMRRKQRSQRKKEAYVPGARNSYEPLAAAVTESRSAEDRLPRARLRAIQGPNRGRTYFLGSGSAVIGTSEDSTVRVNLPGYETSPELVRIWVRDGKYMFHQVRPGPVRLAGRDAQWAVLEDGDEIRIVDDVFVFEIPPVSQARDLTEGAPAQA
jgi:VWFA-related protein